MKLLFIDIETTGLDTKRHSVVEIGAIYLNGNTVEKKFHLVKSLEETMIKSLGALRVNGCRITDYRFSHSSLDQDMKIARGDVHDFVDFLLDITSKDKEVLLAGHNVSFDIKGLQDYLSQHNYEGLNEIFAHRVIDTSTIGQFLRDSGKITMDRMSLGNLAEALGLELEKNKLHTALYDAELSMKCYLKMKQLIQE